MDSLYWGPVRVSQLLAAVTCFAAVVVLMIMMFREHDPANLFVNVKAARLAEAEAEEALAEETEAAENTEEAEEYEEEADE